MLALALAKGTDRWILAAQTAARCFRKGVRDNFLPRDVNRLRERATEHASTFFVRTVMGLRQKRKWAVLARPPISPAGPAVFSGPLVLRQQGGRMLDQVVQTTREQGQIRRLIVVLPSGES